MMPHQSHCACGHQTSHSLVSSSHSLSTVLSFIGVSNHERGFSISTCLPPSSSFSSLTSRSLRRTSLSRPSLFPTQVHLSSSATTSSNFHLKPSNSFGNLGLGFDDRSYASFYPFCSAPQTPATVARGAESDVMGLLLRERIVFLGSSIDDFVADAIISQILLLDALDQTQDIRLFINSPGGSLSATMAIYDVVQLVRADVSTVALGIAASTSFIILGSGMKGKRLAMPNTRIMVHQPMGGASSQAIDMEIQAKKIMHNKKNVIRIVSSFNGRSSEQVEKDIDRDHYMSPVEAVEYGIIDGVIDKDLVYHLCLFQRK